MRPLVRPVACSVMGAVLVRWLVRVHTSERGQTVVEYIGVLALVALIVLALTQSQLVSRAVTTVTDAVRDLFSPPS